LNDMKIVFIDSLSKFSARFQTYLPYGILFLSFLIPYISLNGQIDDFLFQHIGLIKKYDVDGHVPNIEPLFLERDMGMMGFYILGLILGQTTGITYDYLPNVPVILPSFIVITFYLSRKIFEDNLTSAIVALLFTTFTTNLSYLCFHPHGIGFTVFLFLITLFLRLNPDNELYKKITLIVITLVSINLVSYKSIFWSSSFLFTSYIILFLISLKRIQSLDLYKYLAFFTSSLVLGFNKFFFDWYIPLLNRDLSPFNGLYNALNYFTHKRYDVLTENHLSFSYPFTIKILVFTRQVIIGYLIVAAIWEILRNRRKTSFEYKHIVYLILTLVGVINIIFYTGIGLFDIKFLSYIGLIGLPVLRSLSSHRIRYITLFLVVSNLLFISESRANGIINLDESYFDYIEPSVKYYEKFSGHKTSGMTDVLTKTYFIKSLIENQENRNHPTHFSDSSVLKILGYISFSNRETDDQTVFIVNYKLDHYSITNWKIIKSFNFYRNRVENNCNLNKMYTYSKWISFYSH
jgi:hypothetical protein